MRDKSLPLMTKWRPTSLDELIGNEAVIESLKSILAREEGRPHAFLLTGPSGTGKTTTARIIAKELKCSDRDLTELNMASSRGIDTIREIATNCSYAPIAGKSKVYILDEAARQTLDSQSALLKIIEDPPKHSYFILCTTDPEKLLKTIKTRCANFTFTALQKAKVLKLLKWVCSGEGVELSAEVLKKISECCDGSPRQALVLLDQIIDLVDDQIALQTIVDLTINETQVLDLYKSLIANKKWNDIAGIINIINENDWEKVRWAMLGLATNDLLKTNNPRAKAIIVEFHEPFYNCGKAGLVMACNMLCEK